MGKSITFSYNPSAERSSIQKVQKTNKLMTQVKDIIMGNLLPFLKTLPPIDRQALFEEVNLIKLKLDRFPKAVEEKVFDVSASKEVMQHTYIFDVETVFDSDVPIVEFHNLVLQTYEGANATQNN